MTTTPHRAQWLAEGSYGIMTHYLLGNDSKANEIVDNFDLDYFMKQFDESGADWLIFTIGQCTGFYSSPNEYLNKIAPGHTSSRDLVLEIAKAVKSRGKRFISYIPCVPGTPGDELSTVFEWVVEEGKQDVFLSKWFEFIRAYSLKLGKLNDGWWFDGAYEFYHHNKWDWSKWNDAARAGNPDSITCYNDGAFCCGILAPVTPLEDYHAGEVHLLEDGKIRFEFLGGLDTYLNEDGHLMMPTSTEGPKYYMPDSQYIDGVQWHALVPVDSTFNGAVPDKYTRYSPEFLAKFTADCKKVKGGVTYNLPIDASNGHIPEESIEKIRKMGELLRKG